MSGINESHRPVTPKPISGTSGTQPYENLRRAGTNLFGTRIISWLFDNKAGESTISSTLRDGVKSARDILNPQVTHYQSEATEIESDSNAKKLMDHDSQEIPYDSNARRIFGKKILDWLEKKISSPDIASPEWKNSSEEQIHDILGNPNKELADMQIKAELQAARTTAKKNIDEKIENALQRGDLGPITKMKLEQAKKSLKSEFHPYTTTIEELKDHEGKIDQIINKGSDIQKSARKPISEKTDEIKRDLNAFTEYLGYEFIISKESRSPKEKVAAKNILKDIELILREIQILGDSPIINNELLAYRDSIQAQIAYQIRNNTQLKVQFYNKVLENRGLSEKAPSDERNSLFYVDVETPRS